jgi:hypothetical protein
MYIPPEVSQQNVKNRKLMQIEWKTSRHKCMALTGIKCESTNYAGCRRRKKPESRIRKGYRALCTLGKQMGYVMLKDDLGNC